MMRHAHATPLALAAFLLTTGCSTGLGTLEEDVAKILKRPGGPIEPIPEVKTYEPFTYSAFDLRDPFSAPKLAQEGQGNGLRPDTERHKEPLELYPLDDLLLVGVIEKNTRIHALIRSSDGTIHQVTVGNYVGQNYGRITSIQEDRVDLTEIIPDGAGGWIERPASIAMREGTQGNKP